MTKQFSNYSDLITFTRASGGHALRPVSYGDELVTNGDFSDGTNGFSALNTDISISNVSEELQAVSTATSGVLVVGGVSVTVGKIYVFSAESTSSTINHRVRLGTSSAGSQIHNFPASSTPTVFRHVFVATTDIVYVYLRNDVAGTVKWDNVTLKEVLFDQSDGTLTLFEHPTNIPRVEYDADGNRLGLLVEEARTNLVTYSEDFTDASWETVGTKVPNSATSPTGENNASLLSVNYLEIRPSVVSGTQYTYSIFVKGLTDFTPQIIATGTSFPNTQANFDLSDGTVTSTTAEDATIKDCGNGWFRISITETATATDSTSRLRLFCEQAYIFGAQLETGSFPTSYIKTTGSTATRSADVASIPVADFGYNHKEGTIFAEFSGQFNESGTLFPRPYELSGGNSSNDRVTVYFAESNGNLAAEVRNGGVQSAGLVLQAGVSSDFSAIKTAFAFKADDFAATEDGDTPVTDTAGTFTPSTPRDELALMATVTGSQTLNGHLKSIKYYPRRLTNAQLQDITS